MREQHAQVGWVYGEPQVGTVARIVRERGFGFIRSGPTDYFFHQADYDGELERLQEKTVVTFIPTETPKGPRATNVARKLG